MKKRTTILALAILPFFYSCSSPKQNANSESLQEETVKTTKVDYKVADNYFIKNDVKGQVPNKITSQEDFDKYFGLGAIMGENGKPTPIDFSKEYVIVADYDTTSKNVSLNPIDLVLSENDLVLNYSVTEEGDAGFTSRPFLIVIVSENPSQNVILKPSVISK